MEHIEHILYINLDHRTDRFSEINQELTRMNLLDRAERFPAIHIPEQGALGCTMSHLLALHHAKENNWNSVLILEDDFKFIVDQETLHHNLHDFFSSDENIYDVLMFSYNLQGPTMKVNKVVSRTRCVQTASGYMVHRKFYDALIENLTEAVQLLEETKISEKYINDQYWKHLQSPDKPYIWYIFNQRMGIQRPSYSDIEKKYVNYNL